MQNAAAVLGSALAVVLVVVVPIRGYRRYVALRDLGPDPAARSAMLRRSNLVKWAMALAALGVWALSGQGDKVVWWGPYAWWLGAALLVGVAVGAWRIRRLVGSPDGRVRLSRAAAGFTSLLPGTDEERRRFVGVAVTAGVTEEILYRAYLLGYLAWLWPSAPGWVLCALGGLSFGTLHAYQGWRGTFATAVLGFAFGIVYLGGGLLVVMAIHTLIDLRLLLIPVEVVAQLRAAAPTDDPATSPPELG